MLQVYQLAEFQDYIARWNRAGGYGLLIDLREVDLSHLTTIFTELFTDEQMAGDGSCPRCLAADHSRSTYSHRETVICDGCGFKIQL